MKRVRVLSEKNKKKKKKKKGRKKQKMPFSSSPVSIILSDTRDIIKS